MNTVTCPVPGTSPQALLIFAAGIQGAAPQRLHIAGEVFPRFQRNLEQMDVS